MNKFTFILYATLLNTKVCCAGPRSLAIVEFSRSRVSDFLHAIVRTREVFYKHNGLIEALTYNVKTMEGKQWPASRAISLLSFKSSVGTREWLNHALNSQEGDTWLDGRGASAIIVQTDGLFPKNAKGLLLAFLDSHDNRTLLRNYALEWKDLFSQCCGVITHQWETILGHSFREAASNRWIAVIPVQKMQAASNLSSSGEYQYLQDSYKNLKKNTTLYMIPKFQTNGVGSALLIIPYLTVFSGFIVIHIILYKFSV